MPKSAYKLVKDFFHRPIKIPEDWEYPKFAVVVKVNPPTKIDEKKVPYIPMDAVDTRNPHFNYFEERNLSDFASLPKFQENDVLFASITPSTENGKTCIVENFARKGIGSSELTVLRPTEKIMPRYLYYYVKSHRIRQFAISQMMGTTGRQRVPDYVFKKDLSFELPSHNEQQKIASILSNIDSLIVQYDKVIDSTRKLKQGLMQQLLTKGIGHTKFKKVIWYFGKEIEIPKDWKSLELRNLCEPRQGLQIPISERFRESGPNRLQYITVKSIHSGKFDEYIENPATRVICNEDDILFTRTGNTGEIITNVKGVFHNNFFLVDFDRMVLLRDYLISFLKQQRIQEIIISLAGSTTIPDLNHGDFLRLKITIPSLSEQQKIVSILNTVDSKITDLQSKKSSLEKLKKGLMQKLLTGQIRVPIS